MNQTIEIIDRGRGPQLSTTRITVLDLVPYFQTDSSNDEIMRWLPTLTPEEIGVAQRYYQDHKEECDHQDCRVRAHREEQIRLQRLRYPEIEENSETRFQRLKGLLQKKMEGKNGASHPG